MTYIKKLKKYQELKEKMIDIGDQMDSINDRIHEFGKKKEEINNEINDLFFLRGELNERWRSIYSERNGISTKYYICLDISTLKETKIPYQFVISAHTKIKLTDKGELPLGDSVELLSFAYVHELFGRDNIEKLVPGIPLLVVVDKYGDYLVVDEQKENK